MRRKTIREWIDRNLFAIEIEIEMNESMNRVLLYTNEGSNIENKMIGNPTPTPLKQTITPLSNSNDLKRDHFSFSSFSFNWMFN